MALGLLWLVQALGGTCDYGGAARGAEAAGACRGCYLPSGVAPMRCPAGGGLASGASESHPGSLQGTLLFTALCVALVATTLVLTRGSLSAGPAAALLAVYAGYAVYQVVAQRMPAVVVCLPGDAGWCM